MKKLYWRPNKVSRSVLALVAILALGGMTAVEAFLTQAKQPWYAEKLAAARLTRDAFEALRIERTRRQPAIDPETDPTRSGMMGLLMSAVTSNSGSLPAKQTSVNPNFAAVIVQMLKRAGVNEGDVVAVGVSGSFPALNVATYAALKTVGAKPVIVSSVAASQWGANVPGFSWLDMERVLRQRNLFPYKSLAASMGGIEDRGLGMSKEGRKELVDAIVRNDVAHIKPANYNASVEERMRLFVEGAAGTPVKAYVNIGGGTTSVGTKVGKRLFKPGLNRTLPEGASGLDSVMARFVEDGVPVIHLVNVDQLALRYGLPLQPKTMPNVGEGKIFVREVYNLWLAGGVLVTILAFLYLFIRSDLGYRIVQSARRPASSGGRPEQMV